MSEKYTPGSCDDWAAGFYDEEEDKPESVLVGALERLLQACEADFMKRGRETCGMMEAKVAARAALAKAKETP